MSNEDYEKTRVIRRNLPPPPEPKAEPELPPQADSEESEMTRLIRAPQRASSASAPEPATRSSSESDGRFAGWLVIVAGPGYSSVCQVGYGQNGIGRDKAERISLDFGDENLSRKGHCFLIYEPRERKFVLRPGAGANLTYLNKQLLAEPRELKAGDVIEIGQTILRFVPLCGPDFDWEEQQS